MVGERRPLWRRLARRLVGRLARGALEAERLLARPAYLAEALEPPQGGVLVLAPHMDDESFGAGATLAAAVAAGARVRVLFLTDGGRGRLADPGESAEQRATATRELVARRRGEAAAALRALGIGDWRGLDLPDGELAAHLEPAATAIADEFAAAAPTVVMLPFLNDPHPDHRATGAALALACARRPPPPETRVWAYEIWAPLPANAVVDAGPTLAAKQAAMACYASQTGQRDYLRTLLALNAYRSLAGPPGCTHAEAFFVADIDAYCALLDGSPPGP